LQPCSGLCARPGILAELRGALLVPLILLAAACASKQTVKPMRQPPLEVHAQIEHALPAYVADRSSWSSDIYTALIKQQIEPSHEHICAIIAVIEQESGFHVNPAIPGLPAIAWKEIRRRANSAGVPWLLVSGALSLTSANGKTYAQRIDAAHTEKDLSDIYEDFIGAVPLGKTLFSDRNPIRTRGPMQVNVAFLKQTAAAEHYPYPVRGNLADELFTRRGSVYFGTAHLLGYPASYDSYVYRFADYNAGQYASRNAAFQIALGKVAHRHVIPDGSLLPHDGAAGSGDTEGAAREIAGRLGLSEDAIHDALSKGRSADLETTRLYRRVYELAGNSAQRPAARAVVPRIDLQGPKISRHLTTDWYAHRVAERFDRCLQR
jgi:Protein of unknown function (DUF1615)